jgi:hypothetical protein
VVETLKAAEPFDLSARAIERIARDAGADDANTARRILRAYWHSKERRARDAALVEQGIRDVDSVLQRELPHEVSVDISRVLRQDRRRFAG